jgi:aminobenzoyl-glutamate utilization protein B
MKIKALLLTVVLSLSACAFAQAASGGASAEQKNFAYGVVEKNAQTMFDIADSIYYFGELGMQEFESTKLLKESMEAAGFKVELGGAGMPTNFWAMWGSGKPYILIESEVDALPGGSQTPLDFEHKPLVPGGPGHMEGHNTHGGVATTAAFAVKQTMERYHLPGTVAVHFGPAEEAIGSRPFVVRAGYFKDVDAAVILHISQNFGTGWGLQNYAAIGTKFTFHGKTAHGAVAPWEGKNALDALELMDMGVAFLRQQLHPTYRIHRSITMGGLQPNIIPDLTQVWYFVRDANMPDAKETWDKVVNIAKGAALMTGTTVDVEYQASAWPQLSMKSLATVVQKNIDAVGMPKWTDEEQKFARDFQAAMKVPVVGLWITPTPLGGRPQAFSSNDNGDVSWVVPAVIYAFPASVPGINYHNWQAGVTPTSTIAHKGEVAGAKVLAATILDMMTSPEVLKAARAEWEQATTQSPYFSLLPADAKPDVNMNRETMLKFRPQMTKFYLNKTPRFQ